METVKYCSPGVFSYTAFFTVYPCLAKHVHTGVLAKHVHTEVPLHVCTCFAKQGYSSTLSRPPLCVFCKTGTLSRPPLCVFCKTGTLSRPPLCVFCKTGTLSRPPLCVFCKGGVYSSTFPSTAYAHTCKSCLCCCLPWKHPLQ